MKRNMTRREQKRFVATNVLIGFVCTLVLMSLSMACAGKNMTPKTVAGNVATYGTTLVQSVDAVRAAVVQGEAQGSIPRNEAVKVMQGISKVADQAQNVSGYLKTLASLPSGSPEATSTIAKVQSILDVLSSDVMGLLVPVGNENTRTQLSQLLVEVNKTISTINREVLGRAR